MAPGVVGYRTARLGVSLQIVSYLLRSISGEALLYQGSEAGDVRCCLARSKEVLTIRLRMYPVSANYVGLDSVVRSRTLTAESFDRRGVSDSRCSYREHACIGALGRILDAATGGMVQWILPAGQLQLNPVRRSAGHASYRQAVRAARCNK